MIKFFRHIRKSLLMENPPAGRAGKTGKPALPASLSGRQAGRYFKYAIGEIVLVVIGILVALQINNWNEERKDRKAESIALSNLELDIEEGIRALQVHLKSQEIWIEDCVNVLTHLEEGKGFLGQDNVFTQINDLLVRSHSGQANTTYETLKSTGKLDLIRNEALKKEIVLYYKNLEGFSNNTTNNNTNFVDLLINPVLINYTVFQSHDFTDKLKAWWPTAGTINYQMQKTDHLQAVIEKALSNDHNHLKLLNVINFRLLLASIQKEEALDILQKSEQLLEAVKMELKNFNP